MRNFGKVEILIVECKNTKGMAVLDKKDIERKYSSAIRIDGCKNIHLERNSSFGFDIGIDITNSEGITALNNMHYESFEGSLDLNKNIEAAKKGDKKAISFLKDVLEKITVETVAISYKAYLSAHGIEV